MSGKRRATLAQRQFDRFQTLAGRQAISQAEMDVQRANRDAANAALKIAREELAQMSLIAPFSGIAAGVHIRNHQVVAAGQPVITLTRTDLLDVVFSIPENLFTSLDIRNTAYRPSSGSIPCRPRVYRGIQRAYRQQRQ
ncbi:multidrug resistance protein MdtN [Serratia liquefaciens]|nr:multidrug resistance protein MdtN [Serratia liquefaciens]